MSRSSGYVHLCDIAWSEQSQRFYATALPRKIIGSFWNFLENFENIWESELSPWIFHSNRYRMLINCSCLSNKYPHAQPDLSSQISYSKWLTCVLEYQIVEPLNIFLLVLMMINWRFDVTWISNSHWRKWNVHFINCPA